MTRRRYPLWSSRPPTTRRLLLTLAGVVVVAVSIALRQLGPARGAHRYTANPSAPLPATAVVARVIDGDTVELADGRRVRYLGINTPETRHRVGQQWVYAPEPFAEEATKVNRRLVEGKTVRLEFDVRSYDKYHRLLAHVYVGDTLVNAELLQRGLARVLVIPPNVRHAEEFESLERAARKQRVGLWSR